MESLHSQVYHLGKYYQYNFLEIDSPVSKVSSPKGANNALHWQNIFVQGDFAYMT